MNQGQSRQKELSCPCCNFCINSVFGCSPVIETTITSLLYLIPTGTSKVMCWYGSFVSQCLYRLHLVLISKLLGRSSHKSLCKVSGEICRGLTGGGPSFPFLYNLRYTGRYRPIPVIKPIDQGLIYKNVLRFYT